MEALAAIGLASSIITFIDFGYELISVARDIHGSSTGHSKENTRIEFLNTRMEALAADLSAKTSTSTMTEDEKRLSELSEECLRLLGDLKKLLDKLKVGDHHSKRQLIRSVLRNMRKDEKKGLEERLNACRAQLHLQFSQTTWFVFPPSDVCRPGRMLLLTCSRLQSMQQINLIAEHGKCQDAHLQQLKQQLIGLQNALDQMSSKSVMLDDIKLLLSRPRQALDKVLQNTVLEALRFEEMEKRFDDIEDAHVDTCRWLLDDPYALSQSKSATTTSTSASSSSASQDHAESLLEEELPAHLQARVRFIDWLEGGRGIFHISGKPGAGKSTLMKYMTGSPELQRYLKSWAGSKQLVFASFFFWKHGTEYQRSFAGLIRSLLHSALSQCPELLSKVFPTQWKTAEDGFTVRFDKAEVRTAFEILMKQSQLYHDRKLAIFIDGLDEFVGHEDSLLSGLFDWVDSGLDNIKICVSSREHTIFQQRFAACPKIRLHEINHYDILGFVEEKLRKNKDANLPPYELEEVIRLGRELIYDAEGVFLWASLAVRVLEKGLLINDSIPQLRAKIKSLPSELEKLFEHIFRSIQTDLDPDERQRAMQILSIFVQQAKVKWPFPYDYRYNERAKSIDLLQLSFLDEYERDPTFSVRLVGPLSDGELDRRLERCRRVVNFVCMGLVSVTSSDESCIDTNTSDARPSTRFRTETALLAHRSLIEFFKRSDVGDEIERFTKDFDFLQFSCQSLIAELKASASPYLEGFQLVKTASKQNDFVFTRRKLPSHEQQRVSLPPDTFTTRDVYFAESEVGRDLAWLTYIFYSARPHSVSTLRSTFDELADIADTEVHSNPLPCEKVIDYPYNWEVCDMPYFLPCLINCRPSDYCRWTGFELGIYELWPMDDGVGPASFSPDTMLHLVTSTIQFRHRSLDSHPFHYGLPGIDSKVVDRLVQASTLALAKGASPNVKPPELSCLRDDSHILQISNITQWQLVTWNCIIAGAELRMPIQAMWLLFLIHGADTKIQLTFRRHSRISADRDLQGFACEGQEGPQLIMSGKFGKKKRELFTPVVVAENHGGIVDLAKSQGGIVSLRDIVSLWFPDQADDFRSVIDLNENRVGKPSAEELRCLRQKHGFDLDNWQVREWKVPQPLLKSWSGESEIIKSLETSEDLD